LLAESSQTVRSAAELFQQAAARAPGNAAARCGAVELTYDQLAGRAAGVAARLRDSGVGRGDIVATVQERSTRQVVSMLAAWSVGAAILHFDDSDPDERISRLLGRVRASAVLTDGAHRVRVTAPGVPVLDIDTCSPALPYVVDPRLGPGDLAYVVLTSGTTGIPKAVAVEHRSLLSWYAAARQFRGDIELGSFGLVTTFAADSGLDCVFGALLSGGRLDIYRQQTVLDPPAFADELARHPVDMTVHSPSLLETLAETQELGRFLPRRLLVVGGEALPPRLPGAILRARPGLPVINSYGPSEATIEVIVHWLRGSDVSRTRIPIGRPLESVIARVLDGNGAEVANGNPGVLYVGGPFLSRGYLGDPVSTSDKFITTSSGERLYRTGDIVIRDSDGVYDFLGRDDRQVKIRGHRIEPAEVEIALLAQPGISRALVTAEPASPGGMQLVAYVVASPGSADPAEIASRLRQALPMALVPSRIHLVASIPVTPNGKADLAALAAMVIPVAPSAPGTGTERIVADVWRTVLGRTDIDPHEPFMEAGGDSLKALRVFAELRRHFPDFTMADLFQYPTISDPAAALDPGEAHVTASPAVVEL
jgi:amino acid adenylation domain-containing protein